MLTPFWKASRADRGEVIELGHHEAIGARGAIREAAREQVFAHVPRQAWQRPQQADKADGELQ